MALPGLSTRAPRSRAWLAVPVLALPALFPLAGLAIGCARQAVSLTGGALTASYNQLPVVERATTHKTQGGQERSDTLARVSPKLPKLLSTAVPALSIHREDELMPGDRPLGSNGLCPPDMASVDDRYCIDRYEGSLLEVLPNGDERSFSPYSGPEGRIVRAVSEADVVPQAYISGRQAKDACHVSGKRLCRESEWRTACAGPEKRKYGYGDSSEAGRCNDSGRGPLGIVWGQLGEELYTWDKMNAPALNQLVGTVAKTGAHEGCANGYGVFDMVGNLHEWIDDPKGTFLGGYYLDTHQLGDGCGYTADAHDFEYHDYSTGFRCCSDVAQ